MFETRPSSSSSDDHVFASITGLQGAIRTQNITCGDIMHHFITRIADVDPEINAIVSMNARAMDEAAALDVANEAKRVAANERGPLFGLPILIKDNIETEGIITTYGSVICRGMVPSADAHLITRFKDAHAVILAKTTLPDWAQGYFSTSSLSKLTQHPMDHTRDPGGSSSGCAAAVAAGMAIAAIGSDTGGSVRLPAAFCGLVGLRPTPGRVSRHGIATILEPWDTAGPITKNVEDAASIMDVITSFDERDDYTSINECGEIPSFSRAVKSPRLSGRRLGVLRQLFGSQAGILATLECAMSALADAQVTLVEVVVPDLDQSLASVGPFSMRSRSDMNRFFAKRPALTDLTVESIVAEKKYHPGLDFLEASAKAPQDFLHAPEYACAVNAAEKLSRVIMCIFAQEHLDAIIYPTCQLLAPKTKDILAKRWSDPQYPTNTMLASALRWTAISVPIGLAKDDEYPTDPALPVGLEILGLPLQEARILNIAAGLQRIHG